VAGLLRPRGLGGASEIAHRLVAGELLWPAPRGAAFGGHTPMLPPGVTPAKIHADVGQP
jgi:hypothetical protein